MATITMSNLILDLYHRSKTKQNNRDFNAPLHHHGTLQLLCLRKQHNITCLKRNSFKHLLDNLLDIDSHNKVHNVLQHVDKLN